MINKFLDSFKSAPQELILDFDATNDPFHGRQEGRFLHGFYDEYCFLPLANAALVRTSRCVLLHRNCAEFEAV